MRAVSAEVREDLLATLTSWLEAERVEFAAAWTRDGISPTVQVQRPFGHLDMTVEQYADRPGHGEMTALFRFEMKSVEVSRLDLMTDTPIVLGLSTPPPFSALLSAYGDDFVDGALIDQAAVSPDARFKPFFARLAGDYLRKLPAVSISDPVLARSIAESYLTFVESDEITEVESVLIGGIALPAGPVEAGDASLRPLSGEELGELGMRGMHPEWLERPTALPVVLQSRNIASFICTSVLTVRSARPKAGPDERTARRMARLVLALQLMDYDIAGPGIGASWTEPGPRLAQFGIPVPMPAVPPSPPGSRLFASLGRDELQRGLQLAQLISPRCFDEVGDRTEVALHRFSLATSQEQNAEALIDYVIALEALLVPGGTTEAKLRFRLNGARYLTADTAERPVVYADLGTLYDVRSTLVHGAGTKKLKDLSALRRRARQLAASGLIKALDGRFPTPEEFESAALA